MLLFAFVGAAIAIFIAALVWLGVRFIGEALVPAALIAAIGFLLGEVVRLAFGEIRSSRDEARLRVREAEERARAWRLALLADAQRLVERELDAMRAQINGDTPPDRPRRATYRRIDRLEAGSRIRNELEALATRVYQPEKAGTRDQELLTELNFSEDWMTTVLRVLEERTVDSQWPSRLETVEVEVPRNYQGYDGFNDPPD